MIHSVAERIMPARENESTVDGSRKSQREGEGS